LITFACFFLINSGGKPEGLFILTFLLGIAWFLFKFLFYRLLIGVGITGFYVFDFLTSLVSKTKKKQH